MGGSIRAIGAMMRPSLMSMSMLTAWFVVGAAASSGSGPTIAVSVAGVSSDGGKRLVGFGKVVKGHERRD